LQGKTIWIGWNFKTNEKGVGPITNSVPLLTLASFGDITSLWGAKNKRPLFLHSPLQHVSIQLFVHPCWEIHTGKKHTANQTVQQYEKQNHFAAVPPLGYGVLYELIYCIPCHTENQRLFSHCKLKTAINLLKEEIIIYIS